MNDELLGPCDQGEHSSAGSFDSAKNAGLKALRENLRDLREKKNK